MTWLSETVTGSARRNDFDCQSISRNFRFWTGSILLDYTKQRAIKPVSVKPDNLPIEPIREIR